MEGHGEKVDGASEALGKTKVPGLPSSFYYIPNFLSEAECDALLQKVICSNVEIKSSSY
jgi:hypothetical protein